MDEPTNESHGVIAEPSQVGEFFNEPLDVSGLPELHHHEFDRLDPSFLRIRWMADGIFAAIVLVAAVALSFFVPRWIPLAIGAGILALTALAAWMQWLEVNHLGYLVREKDFSFRSGVISRNVTTVPFARVQHVSIDRGPLARFFGLATLQLRTAGDGMAVPGMNHETATRLKTLVVDRAGALADEEVAEDSGAS